MIQLQNLEKQKQYKSIHNKWEEITTLSIENTEIETRKVIKI